MNTNIDLVNQDTTRINGSEAERLRNQLEAGMTLTDITEFLIKEDMMLQKTINKSNEAFSTLTLQLNDFSMDLKRITKIHSPKVFVTSMTTLTFLTKK